MSNKLVIETNAVLVAC